MVYEDHRDPATDDRSVAQLVEELSAEVSRLVRDELTLATAELRSKGVELPPDKPKGEHFDSNCITPVSVGGRTAMGSSSV